MLQCGLRIQEKIKARPQNTSFRLFDPKHNISEFYFRRKEMMCAAVKVPGNYSTVTDLARLRGLSTSHPFATPIK